MSGPGVQAAIPTYAEAITKSDTATNAFSYIYVGTTGNVVVTTEDGQTVTFTAVPAGQYIWVRTRRVMAATTASNMVGLR
jgi:lipocalin